MGETALYYLDSDGTAYEALLDLMVSQRGTQGDKLKLPEKSQLLTVIPYRASLRNFVVTRSGLVYPFPAFERLDLVLNAPEFKYLKDAFMQGASLLPLPESVSSDDRIVLLTNKGRIVCSSVSLLDDVSNTGVQLAKITKDDEMVVSACLLTSGQDLLIFTESGYTLLVAASSIRTCTGKAIQPWNGIKLQGNNQAVCCLPHCQELLIAKEDGSLAALNRKINPVVTLNSMGVELTKGSHVISAFPRTDYIIMADHKGYMAVLDSKDFTSKNKNQGIKAKGLARNAKMVCAFGVDAGQKTNPSFEEQGTMTKDTEEAADE